MEELTQEVRLRHAQNASNLAMGSVLLVFMMSCGGPLTLLIALPLSLWGLYIARLALSDDWDDDMIYAYGNPAMIINGMVALYSFLMMLLYLSIFALYMGMFAMIFAIEGL